jgi:hypothetical protein
MDLRVSAPRRRHQSEGSAIASPTVYAVVPPAWDGRTSRSRRWGAVIVPDPTTQNRYC